MKMSRRKVTLLAALGGAMLAFGVFLGVEAAEKSIQAKNILLVAHRAGADSAPENTVAALEQAIWDGAVMAEIDVQQLADGTLIVMHDSNFLRTTGVDKNVWETNCEEMRRFKDIPTLEEMLLCADSRIILMIELKYTGYEDNMVAAVLELLERYRMKQSCIIGSMNMGILERVKQMDPQIQTVFIAHNLDEEQYELSCADSYSIEAKNLTRDMVDRLHEQNKPVYGWTANSQEQMRHILKCGADGIVTDKVALAEAFLRRYKSLWRSRWLFEGYKFAKNYLPSVKKMV